MNKFRTEEANIRFHKLCGMLQDRDKDLHIWVDEMYTVACASDQVREQVEDLTKELEKMHAAENFERNAKLNLRDALKLANARVEELSREVAELNTVAKARVEGSTSRKAP